MEDKAMDYCDKVSKFHGSGFNCAQVVAAVCSDLSGTDEKTALTAMGGFGGGMRCGEVCGAVSGGVYTLSLYCPYSDATDKQAKEKIAELTKSFTAAFKDEFGSLVCRDLIAGENAGRCEEYMARASELIHEIVERDKHK